jgi:hypothetical protein
LVKEFQVGNLDLFRLNFALLTMIPKVENAMEMKKIRPISLLNCSFKTFGKLMTSRLERVCQRLIAKEQSAFINFYKSEFIPMNLEENLSHGVGHILNCPRGQLPLKYLGVLLHFDRLKREDVQPLVDKLIKGIADLRGMLLSYSSRLVLIKACLMSIPVYILSFIKFPKWTVKLL